MDSKHYQSFNGESSGVVVKRWQRWPGQNFFFFDGRCILGSSYYWAFGTLCAMIVPMILWLSVIWTELPWYLILISMIIFILCLASFFAAACSDPGIIRRCQPGETAEYVFSFFLQISF